MHADDADEELARLLLAQDVAVLDNWLDPAARVALLARARALAAAGALEPARIGRGAAAQREPALRGDAVRWLGPDDPGEAAMLARFERLRTVLNRTLYLGLAECEAHFAHYPPGARYARHRDRFRDDDRRVVSLVVYLAGDWQAADGGALRLHGVAADGAALDVLPLAARAVAFLSASVEHEVLPATRDRYSIAAWFRRA